MSKKGVSKISGNPAPKVGEKTTYMVTDWYPSTPADERNPAAVTWELFKKRSDGSFTTTNIKKTRDGSFTFGEVAAKNTYRLEAYLHEPEGSGPTTLDITPQPAGIPKINKVELRYVDDSPGTVFSYTEKMVALAHCVNLTGEKLLFTLWEDDAAGEGHNSKNKFVDSKQAVVGRTGTATAEFVLTKALMQKAAQGERDPKELEFYVTVEYYKDKKHASDNRSVKNPDYKPPVQQPQSAAPTKGNAPAPASKTPPKAAGSPAAAKPASQKEESGIIDSITESVRNKWNELWDWAESKGTVKPDKKATSPKPEGKTTSVVEGTRTEGVIDVFFAKEEFTIQTDETAGQHEYKFKSDNNNIDKDKIAAIIKSKIDPAVKAEKKYTKLDNIKSTLTKNSYKKDEVLQINLFKLGPEFVKINSVPIGEEVYVVAKTYLLDGKEVTINIKEKDALFVAKDADLTVLEAKENGNEITVLKAVVQKNTAKIKIKLRPKADEKLAEWREKLNGVKDGSHTYIFGGNNATATDKQKRDVAKTIADKIKSELATQKKITRIETIAKALTKDAYGKNEQVTFDVYKNVTEYIWLKAECKGDIKKHTGDFLKKDGAYFIITKTKPVIFPLLVKPENDEEKTWGKNYYWAADQGSNMTTFNSNRSSGRRKHAGRDLYTLPKTTVVSIADGVVLKTAPFYAQTDYIAVHHTTNDGREFIINYGEVDPGTKLVKEGDKVTQGQKLGVTGHLQGITVIAGQTIYMIHFEHYSGSLGFDMDKNHILSGDNKYKRRGDLLDPLDILEEGYKNTFGEDLGDGELFTVEDGKKAIQDLYNAYKDSKWNWKWEGSDKEVEVTGKQLVTIVEKMYRLETSHFKSKQYQHCGTGGMEVFGDAPYYGWDQNLFTEQPVGTWSAFEGKGLSGAGGNAQVTDRKKEFVKLPSVLSGMQYKAKYIIKHNGNYARWFNASDTTAQTSYRTSLQNIRARFINEIAPD
ncbi:murein DD-endopeptidase MepM/ murein hydrolase activator NlpD [Chryseobacterium sp. SORGH_AS 447]|uniref:peptidoglycan DD-metalloendopeptidase family protein n=1 Tax=Chryseobacterium sp. SORGH_AS_0447 TaxID=3041769 RepID=UPI002787455E|nr:M23 family metallopeptidase [Chryseobacterium sp. SORGH_AS_0447]MDQ1163154.1 murein DD-endopeptidase MepM/ murein hydrolase activator NlpD [Chryseobacterium sp. SORGH_AS_0447]